MYSCPDKMDRKYSRSWFSLDSSLLDMKNNIYDRIHILSLRRVIKKYTYFCVTCQTVFLACCESLWYSAFWLSCKAAYKLSREKYLSYTKFTKSQGQVLLRNCSLVMPVDQKKIYKFLTSNQGTKICNDDMWRTY